MESAVIDIGRIALLEDIGHAVHVLLISNIMLERRDDANALHALNRLRCPDRLQRGIRSKALPDTS